jgi:hypothetical protein
MWNRTLRITMGITLAVVISLVLILPVIAHALSTNVVRDDGTDGSVSGNTITKADGSVTVVGTNSNGQLTVTTVDPNNNGYTVTTTTYNSNGQPVSQTTTTVSKGQTFTTTNTYTTQTITKTYTQYIYDIYVMDHYIYYYMYPIIKWVFTLVNIGQYQAPGYHSIGNEKLFTPGFGGGSGIFVPVFAQEAIYIFNIAPTTKPQITGWYTGSTSQSTSGPYLVSQSSTPPQLTGIQDTVNTIQQQASYTVPNITKTTTYWNYNNGGGTTGTSPTPNPSPTNSPQPTTGQEPWVQFWKAGPYGPNSAGILGNTVVKYNNTGGPITTYNPNVAQSYQQIWSQSAQVWSNAFQSLGNAISNTLDAIGSALTNVATAPINILTGFANAIGNAISNGLRAVNLP